MSEKNKLLYEELSGLDRDHLIQHIEKSLNDDITKGFYQKSDGSSIFWNIEFKTYEPTSIEELFKKTIEQVDIPSYRTLLRAEDMGLTKEELEDVYRNIPNTVALDYLKKIDEIRMKERYHE